MRNELNTLVVYIIKEFRENTPLISQTAEKLLADSIVEYFECDKLIAEELTRNITVLTQSDLLIGKTHYTKHPDQTLEEFRENEITLRVAAEKRASSKNNIDAILENITNKFKVDGAMLKPRLTNLTSFSAYMDRLVTERIKQYNFTLENRSPEIRHQEMLSDFILDDIKTLLKDARQFGYFYVGEKRTFDEKDIIENLKVAK